MNSNTKKVKKSNFSGQLGFVMAAAGSAVGVGNIWRFPYLAAKDGGGLFLCIYLGLILTFGFTLLATDTAIGRKTGKNALQAFAELGEKFKFIGFITYLVPVLIITYYTVIGGWILRYIFGYLTMQGGLLASDGFFSSFISHPYSPIIFTMIFLAMTAFIVLMGVEKGIEKFSKYMMPALFVMIGIISIYSLTLSYTDGGVTRTGMEGFLAYVVPDFSGLTFSRFFEILLDAMSQLFFSLSVAMGIMITYGSYVKKEVNLSKSLSQIEFFDTLVAFLAGMMILPAVYVFFGTEGMSAGPGLIFISLPKIFEAMGNFGTIIGIIFFVMVFFAALTSCISVMEAIVANSMDIFKTDRKKACIGTILYTIAGTILVCLGYNALFFEITLPNGTVGQILDIFDYISNSLMMPIVSLLTCIIIGWVKKPQWIIEEMEASGHPFHRKKMYAFVIRYLAPILMFILFLQSTGILSMITSKL